MSRRTADRLRFSGAAPFPLIKITPPGFAPWQIERPRLITHLDSARTRQVTMVKAPPGFGKTAIAVEWAHRLRKAGGRVAWMSIDDNDNEPTRFFNCVAAALGQASEIVQDSIFGITKDVSLASSDTIVRTIVRCLSGVEDEFFLFLDDFHRLSDREIGNSLSSLLKHVPNRFHIVVVTRSDVDLVFSPPRAGGHLFELDETQLRFDPDEIKLFLEKERLGDLKPAEVAALEQKTEGWPAALRILAVSYIPSNHCFSDHVKNLSGAVRPLSAYLAELLHGLPPDMVSFMLQISILDRFSIDLCKAVTQNSQAGRSLEKLQSWHVLLGCSDHDGYWLRYPQLLRDYLEHGLRIQSPAQIPRLHRRAARWYAKAGLWCEAIKHSIAAGDNRQAAAWIQQQAMSLVKAGDSLTLIGWQRLLPDAMMRGQHAAKLAIAWGLALAFRFDEVRPLLEEVEQQIADNRTKQSRALLQECDAIRSLVLAYEDNTDEALEIAQRCVDTATEAWTINVASNVIRCCHRKSGNTAAFHAAPWIPFSPDEKRRNIFVSTYRHCINGLMELQQLNPDLAERHYRRALREAVVCSGERSVPATFPASLMAEIRYQRGDFSEAESLVADRLPLISEMGMLDCVRAAYFVLTRIESHRSNFDQAHALLEEAEALSNRRKWSSLFAQFLAERVRLFLMEDRTVEARAWLGHLERHAEKYPLVTATSARSATVISVASARAAIAAAEGRSSEAITMLQKLLASDIVVANRYLAFRINAKFAAALVGGNELEQATTTFAQLLIAAEKSGLSQVLCDEAPWLEIPWSQKKKISSKTKAPKRWGQIKSSIERSQLWRANDAGQPLSVYPITMLSPRERSVINLISLGKSNKEIGRELGITAETVKSYIKNIFTKLDVERRAQAVARAQALGLMRPSMRLPSDE